METPRVRYDTARLVTDMADRGWRATDLAVRAKVSKPTVTRFLRGEFQTATTAKKLAEAFGYSPRRYVLPPKGMRDDSRRTRRTDRARVPVQARAAGNGAARS